MIVSYFRNASIKHKLVILMMMVSCTALGLSTAVNLAIESRSEHEQVLNEFVTMAEIIGANSRAALVFGDSQAATMTLQALTGVSNVSAAHLLNRDGQILASYARNGDVQAGPSSAEILCPKCVPAVGQPQHCIIGDCLCLWYPIMLDGERVGSLYLRVDLAPLHTRIAAHGTAAIAVLLISACVALLLVSFLQHLISRPIESLTRNMQIVSEEEDYGLRMEPRGRDEVGQLMRSFNSMLERIKDREKLLEEANQNLEKRVRERTREMEGTNRELAAEVDERRRAETSLRMLKKGMETTQVGITITNLRGEIIYTNPAEARMHGYVVDELLGQPANCLGPAERRGEGTLAMVKTWQRESEDIRKDGSVFPVQLTSDLVMDASGQPLAVVTVCEDISDRRRAEQALRESEDKFKKICAAAHDAIIMVNHDDEVTVWNEAAEKVFGYNQQEILGKSLHDTLASEEHLPAYEQGFRAFRASGRGSAVGKTLELKARKKDGTLFPIELSLSAVRIGGRWNAIGVARDITERRRGEERLRTSLAEKEVLIKEVHHRVKNNLQVISSLLNLQCKNVAEERTRAELTTARTRIRSMALIHEKLYQAADLAQIDFARYVQEFSRQLFRLYGIDPERVRLALDIENVRLSVDSAIACGMIINELLTNALKYAFPAGRAGEVRVSLAVVEEGNVLCVADDGTGMAGEIEWDKMGTLGLQIVSGLAGQLNGVVAVESDGGTRVSVRFPAVG